MNENSKEVKEQKVTRKWINYLIYPRYQLSLILMNLFIFLGSLIVVCYQTYSSFNTIEVLAMEVDASATASYLKLVGVQKQLVYEAIISSTLLGAVLVFIFTLLFSHKSAGAVYRLKMYFQNISENGHQYELGFREGDMHDDLPEIVNKGIQRIKDDTSKEA